MRFEERAVAAVERSERVQRFACSGATGRGGGSRPPSGELLLRGGRQRQPQNNNSPCHIGQAAVDSHPVYVPSLEIPPVIPSATSTVTIP